MGLHFHWFLPTTGDGRAIVGRGHSVPMSPTTIGSPGRREPEIDYLAQVALAAEQVGFEAVLTPTGTWCEDAWITTAALTRETTTLKFLVAFRPGLISPTLAAQMAATYQRISNGRLLLNVVTGGEEREQKRFGDHLSHDERYARCDEFLQIIRGAWSGEPFDFDGSYYQVTGASVMQPPDPTPGVYFGGSSPAAGEVAARNVDVYLTWGEPPEQVATKITWMREVAARHGRELRFGIRLHVITRNTASEAWAEASRMLDALTPEEIAHSQKALAASSSVGQARMRALHERFRDTGNGADLEIAPNLWAGIGLVRGGAGTALVGSHGQVSERIEEYAALGIEEFILSGHPHLEEAYWFGEGVLRGFREQKPDARPPAELATSAS